MKNILKKSMSLDVYADIFILPVCTSFVENAADLWQPWQTRFTTPLCKGGFFPKIKTIRISPSPHSVKADSEICP